MKQEDDIQAKILMEYARLIAKGEVKPGVEARALAESRVKAQLSAERPPTKTHDTTNEEPTSKIWFEPYEVRKILAVGAVIGVCLGILFAIVVLIIALAKAG